MYIYIYCRSHSSCQYINDCCKSNLIRKILIFIEKNPLPMKLQIS